jgi:hypothetical protein
VPYLPVVLLSYSWSSHSGTPQSNAYSCNVKRMVVHDAILYVSLTFTHLLSPCRSADASIFGRSVTTSSLLLTLARLSPSCLRSFDRAWTNADRPICSSPCVVVSSYRRDPNSLPTQSVHHPQAARPMAQRRRRPCVLPFLSSDPCVLPAILFRVL